MSTHEKTAHCKSLSPEEIESTLERGSRELKDCAVLTALATPKAFLASFPYGQEVIREGRFQTPCYGAAPCEGCAELRSAIEASNAPIPLAVVVHGSVEAYLPLPDSDGRSTLKKSGPVSAPSRPMRLLSEGESFGVFETLDTLFGHAGETPLWGVSSGARSVVLLGRQMSRRDENKLKDVLGIRGLTLSERMASIRGDDWELARSLARPASSTTGEAWKTDVLVFPTASRKGGHTNIIKAHLHLSQVGWQQSRQFRGHLLGEENLTLNKHLASKTIHREERIAMFGVLRQVLAMARGELPVFTPASSEAVLPRGLIEKTLLTFPQRKHVIVLAPRHLRERGDVGFMSVKYNCLPALRLPPPRTFGEFCETVSHAWPKLSGHFLDLGQTSFLTAVDARNEMLKLVNEERDEKIGADEISSKHPFLTGCLRITRGR